MLCISTKMFVRCNASKYSSCILHKILKFMVRAHHVKDLSSGFLKVKTFNIYSLIALFCVHEERSLYE